MVISLNVEEIELLVDTTPGVSLFLLLMLAQLIGKRPTPGRRYGYKELGVLCLGNHGTGRAGGADIGALLSRKKVAPEQEG